MHLVIKLVLVCMVSLGSLVALHLAMSRDGSKTADGGRPAHYHDSQLRRPHLPASASTSHSQSARVVWESRGPRGATIDSVAQRYWNLSDTNRTIQKPRRLFGCSRSAKYCSFNATHPPLPNSPPCCTWAQLMWMLKVSDFLASANVKFWLSRGTAISARRTSTINPWDRDTDLSLFRNDRSSPQIHNPCKDVRAGDSPFTYDYWSSLVGYYDETLFEPFNGEFDWVNPICQKENALELRQSIYTDLYGGGTTETQRVTLKQFGLEYDADVQSDDCIRLCYGKDWIEPAPSWVPQVQLAYHGYVGRRADPTYSWTFRHSRVQCSCP